MPKSLEEYARSRVTRGGYGSISEYFRELVRIDQRYEIEKRERSGPVEPRREPLASAARPDRFRNRY